MYIRFPRVSKWPKFKSLLFNSCNKMATLRIIRPHSSSLQLHSQRRHHQHYLEIVCQELISQVPETSQTPTHYEPKRTAPSEWELSKGAIKEVQWVWVGWGRVQHCKSKTIKREATDPDIQQRLSYILDPPTKTWGGVSSAMSPSYPLLPRCRVSKRSRGGSEGGGFYINCQVSPDIAENHHP